MLGLQQIYSGSGFKAVSRFGSESEVLLWVRIRTKIIPNQFGFGYTTLLTVKIYILNLNMFHTKITKGFYFVAHVLAYLVSQ
jgi:hypothetical protein